jgi:hypothetical protein
MWVLQTGATGIPGDRNLNFWDPRLSKSAKNQRKSFEFTYRDDSIAQGDLYTDNVTIGGFTVCFVLFMTVTIEF